jgi:hypothetical protein
MKASSSILWLGLLLLGACRDRVDEPLATAKTRSPKAPIVYDGPPPPPKVVEDLLVRQYARIRKRGGMPVVVTASGKQAVLYPTLHSARCDSCRKVPQSTDEFECYLSTMLSLSPDGRDPSPHGERLFVRHVPGGGWTANGIDP